MAERRYANAVAILFEPLGKSPRARKFLRLEELPIPLLRQQPKHELGNILRRINRQFSPNRKRVLLSASTLGHSVAACKRFRSLITVRVPRSNLAWSAVPAQTGTLRYLGRDDYLVDRLVDDSAETETGRSRDRELASDRVIG